MSTVYDIASFIRENDSFLLATHINPEGDAIGSAVALSMALDMLGKKNTVYDRDGVPDMCAFMPGSGRVKKSIEGMDTKAMNLIILDCNDLERAGLEGASFRRSAVIDHHGTKRDFGDIRWIEPDAPACGILVYKLIKELGVKITKDIAVNLYTAIAVDTGTFRYNNTTPEALRASAELVEAGANPAFIAESVYETWSEGKFRLLCKTLGTLEITGGIAVMSVTKEMMASTKTTGEDTENFAGYPRTIRGIKASALIRQTDEGAWKASLRSKGDFNVASVAEKFGGGGHRNAAGCRIEGDLNTVKELLTKALEEA